MDYNYYRYKAGLNWDKFIELHPEAEGEKVFPQFIKRHESYTQQRDLICDKFRRRFIDEKDVTKYQRIQVEKMYALAQLEHAFIDVLRVIFGLDPNDKTAMFGDKIENRYSNLVKEHMCKDDDGNDTGLYVGADGLYRVAAFYDEDEADISTMIRWSDYKGAGKAYQTEEPPEDSYDIELFIDGVKIKIPVKKEATEEENLKKQLNIISAFIKCAPLFEGRSTPQGLPPEEMPTTYDPPPQPEPLHFKPYPLNGWEETQGKITDYFAEYSKK